MTDKLDQLEAQSIYILREAYNKIDKLGMLWSIGKDSTALLWLVREAFFGRIPFPMIQLETHMELPEVYAFRDQLQKEWDFELVIEECPPEDQMDKPYRPQPEPQREKPKG